MPFKKAVCLFVCNLIRKPQTPNTHPHRPRDGGDVCIGESVKGGLLLLAILISQALRAVPAMDDTAILKTSS